MGDPRFVAPWKMNSALFMYLRIKGSLYRVLLAFIISSPMATKWVLDYIAFNQGKSTEMILVCKSRGEWEKR